MDSLKAAGVTLVFSEKISTRAASRPELDRAVALVRELRVSGAAVTLVVHEHKRLARGIELAALAEQLKAGGIGLEFLTGELHGSHDRSGIVFTVLAALSGMEREYIRDRTLEGHESARIRGKAIGGAAVTDDAMLAVALHLREQNLSLRDIPAASSSLRAGRRASIPPPADPDAARQRHLAAGGPLQPAQQVQQVQQVQQRRFPAAARAHLSPPSLPERRPARLRPPHGPCRRPCRTSCSACDSTARRRTAIKPPVGLAVTFDPGAPALRRALRALR
jgi:Resolvase, N terminal domain